MLTLEAKDSILDINTATEPTLQPVKHVLREENVHRSTRNVLPRKIESNSLGTLYYRADYELRWLRVIKRMRNRWMEKFEAAAESDDIGAMAQASKELREWCERERALLRIARPAAQTIKEKRGVSAPVVEAITVEEPATEPAKPAT